MEQSNLAARMNAIAKAKHKEMVAAKVNEVMPGILAAINSAAESGTFSIAYGDKCLEDEAVRSSLIGRLQMNGFKAEWKMDRTTSVYPMAVVVSWKHTKRRGGHFERIDIQE